MTADPLAQLPAAFVDAIGRREHLRCTPRTPDWRACPFARFHNMDVLASWGAVTADRAELLRALYPDPADALTDLGCTRAYDYADDFHLGPALAKIVVRRGERVWVQPAKET